MSRSRLIIVPKCEKRRRLASVSTDRGSGSRRHRLSSTARTESAGAIPVSTEMCPKVSPGTRWSTTRPRSTTSTSPGRTTHRWSSGSLSACTIVVPAPKNSTSSPSSSRSSSSPDSASYGGWLPRKSTYSFTAPPPALPVPGTSVPRPAASGETAAGAAGRTRSRLDTVTGEVPMPNRLAAATSPYLLQHADNPVDWWEWGEDAFDEARRRGVPVLLSVGYAACHWCHVMAHESFEDDATAAYLNEHFVSVKVDREERPDVDAVYMQATTSMTGHGGWPMTVVLDHDGNPFFAGTYFPDRPRHGQPAFRQVLEALVEAGPPGPTTYDGWRRRCATTSPARSRPRPRRSVPRRSTTRSPSSPASTTA